MSDQERGTRPQGDGYDLARELTESPSAADRDLAGWCLVARQDDRPQPANWILAGEIGPFRLFAAPLGEGGPEPGERFCPAVAARRGGASARGNR